jgi:uncharacterized membrane protein
MIIFDIIGVLGVILLLVAFASLQSGKITSEQLSYPVMNFIGAGLINISLFKDWNLSAFLIETCWMFISVYGFIKIKRKAAKATL